MCIEICFTGISGYIRRLLVYWRSGCWDGDFCSLEKSKKQQFCIKNIYRLNKNVHVMHTASCASPWMRHHPLLRSHLISFFKSKLIKLNKLFKIFSFNCIASLQNEKTSDVFEVWVVTLFFLKSMRNRTQSCTYMSNLIINIKNDTIF